VVIPSAKKLPACLQAKDHLNIFAPFVCAGFSKDPRQEFSWEWQ
jgi:hypothetical protein